jgi:hypothetical protein
VHEWWTNGGRAREFWGFTKSFGDNPGDSKIPLDLGLCIRECILRTGERTPTGAERPSLLSNAFGPSDEENDFGSRGGGDPGRGEKPRSEATSTGFPGAASGGAASMHRGVGSPAATDSGAHWSTGPRGHPNCSRGHQDRGAIGVGTGNRVSVNGARPLGRATGPESNSGNGGSGQTDPDRVGGHRCRVTGGGADRQRAGQPEPGRQRASPAEPSGTTGDVSGRDEG